MDTTGPIIVGYDGSEGSKLALDWAAGEAAARGTPLRIVYAYRGSDLDTFVARQGRLPLREIALMRSAARRLVVGGAAAVARLGVGVDTSTATDDGDPVEYLLGAAKTASLLVLGSRRRGPVGSVLLGSTSAAVAARAACPVVVVRGPAGDSAEDAPVVVGVDPDDYSDAVLDFAFDYAARQGAPLLVVLCWRVDHLATTTWGPERPAPVEVSAALSRALAGHRERYPGVAVHSTVVRAHPTYGLVAESTAARILVVGARGRHAIAGTLLGSVSQGVLHHATCPVAVVPINGRRP